MRKIIYGPPGTGKTYYLMNELEKFLEKVDPSKIGYFTFSFLSPNKLKQKECRVLK